MSFFYLHNGQFQVSLNALVPAQVPVYDTLSVQLPDTSSIGARRGTGPTPNHRCRCPANALQLLRAVPITPLTRPANRVLQMIAKSTKRP